jgi:hypothetical protein
MVHEAKISRIADFGFEKAWSIGKILDQLLCALCSMLSANLILNSGS